MTEQQNQLMQVNQILMDTHSKGVVIDPSHLTPILAVITTNLISIYNRLDKLPANNVPANQADIKKSVAEILTPLAQNLDKSMLVQSREIEVLKESVQRTNESMKKLVELIQSTQQEPQ